MSGGLPMCGVSSQLNSTSGLARIGADSAIAEEIDDLRARLYQSYDAISDKLFDS